MLPLTKELTYTSLSAIVFSCYYIRSELLVLALADVRILMLTTTDGFGQNIETEWESGSMDGAIGVNSSAAASLFRTRGDLVENLM